MCVCVCVHRDNPNPFAVVFSRALLASSPWPVSVFSASFLSCRRHAGFSSRRGCSPALARAPLGDDIYEYICTDNLYAKGTRAHAQGTDPRVALGAKGDTRVYLYMCWAKVPPDDDIYVDICTHTWIRVCTRYVCICLSSRRHAGFSTRVVCCPARARAPPGENIYIYIYIYIYRETDRETEREREESDGEQATERTRESVSPNPALFPTCNG